MLLIFSTSSFAAADLTAAKSFVSGEVSYLIDILNTAFSKFNITACSDLSATRTTEQTTIAVKGIWIGPVGTADDPAYKIKFVHKAAQKTSLGMEKRIEIYAGTNLDLGAIVEFNCSMTKGFLVQTGAGSDLLETYWDNSVTSAPSVQFRIVGTTDGPVMYTRTSGMAMALDTMSYSSLLTYMSAFGLNYRGPTCPVNTSTDHATLVTAGCEIND